MGDLLGGQIGRPSRQVAIFSPTADAPNGLGMTTDEINDGLAFLRAFAKQEKRKDA
jgi:hypothetical protein